MEWYGYPLHAFKTRNYIIELTVRLIVLSHTQPYQFWRQAVWMTTLKYGYRVEPGKRTPLSGKR